MPPRVRRSTRATRSGTADSAAAPSEAGAAQSDGGSDTGISPAPAPSAEPAEQQASGSGPQPQSQAPVVEEQQATLGTGSRLASTLDDEDVPPPSHVAVG